MRLLHIVLFIVTSAGSGVGVGVRADEVRSYAIVQDDATLKIRGERYRLFGIYIPTLNQICDGRRRGLSCETQAAARALDTKIRGFVRCRKRWTNSDGTITANCYFENEDLSSYLIKTGRAVADEAAPYEYQVLERLARRQGRGLWGFPGGGFVD